LYWRWQGISTWFFLPCRRARTKVAAPEGRLGYNPKVLQIAITHVVGSSGAPRKSNHLEQGLHCHDL
jgi:hypothetical protein